MFWYNYTLYLIRHPFYKISTNFLFIKLYFQKVKFFFEEYFYRLTNNGISDKLTKEKFKRR